MSLGSNIDLEKGLHSEPEKSVTSEKKMNKPYVIAGLFSVCAILLVGVVILCGGNESAVSATVGNPQVLLEYLWKSFTEPGKWECWNCSLFTACCMSPQPFGYPSASEKDGKKDGDENYQRKEAMEIIQADKPYHRIDHESIHGVGSDSGFVFSADRVTDSIIHEERNRFIHKQEENVEREEAEENGPPSIYGASDAWEEMRRIQDEEKRHFCSMGVYTDEQVRHEAARGTRSALQLPEVEAAEKGSQPPKVETEKEGEVAAALRIQSIYRGMDARRKIRDSKSQAAAVQQADSEASQQSVGEASLNNYLGEESTGNSDPVWESSDDSICGRW